MATVRTFPRADVEIERARRWWRRNRPSVPDVFANELIAAFDAIADSPEMHEVVTRRRGKNIRRCRLSTSGYYVFYNYDSITEVVYVLSVWHARRGRGPFRK